MKVIEVRTKATKLTLVGAGAPAYLPWVPQQRLVLDPAVIVAYQVGHVHDSTFSAGAGRRIIHIFIDTVERRYEAGIEVARQLANGEWEPVNTEIIARLINALDGAIDMAHDVRA